MSTAYVALGAAGDVASILPILYGESLRGNRSTLVISSEYSPILDGVTYCDSLVYPIHYSEQLKAMNQANQSRRFSKVLSAQAYGSGSGRFTESFQKDAYVLAGKQHEFGKFPLVFDNRDFEREREMSSVIKGDKPVILYAGEGKSSPFQHAGALGHYLDNKWGKDFQIVNLSSIRAHRFYDLLGLYDRASLLICIDSGPLHLANASKVPTICLLTDKPDKWHSAIPPKSSLLSFYYSEYADKLSEIDRVIEEIPNKRRGRKIWHVYSEFWGVGDELVRNRFSSSTWNNAYQEGNWQPRPVKDNELHRDASAIGSPKKVPFINDVINKGIEEAADEDIIVLSNMDTCFAIGITDAILEEMKHVSAFTSHRYDFNSLESPLRPLEVLSGDWYCGCDLVCFTKGFWMEKKHDYPEMLTSFEAWDWIMREFIEKHGGSRWDGGMVYHKRHPSFWYRPDIKNSHPAQLYNVRVAKAWLNANNRPLNELSRR